MTTISASVRQAGHVIFQTGTEPAEINPVYRSLLQRPSETPPGSSTAGSQSVADVGIDLSAAERDLLIRHATSRAVLALAVTTGGSTRRLRLGLGPGPVTVERSEDGSESLWSELDRTALPSLISGFVESTGPFGAAPRLTVARECDGLRLTPVQVEQARAVLEDGTGALDAFAQLDGLDARLRDALLATGDRAALSLTLHDPFARVAEQPVSWSRLWVVGERGMYRMDSPAIGGGNVHPVEPGDLLGSALPIIEEGLRFTAECAAAGGRR